MVAYFQLQPAETELQELADEYWKKSGQKERELEQAAFEAGEAIRNGEHTLGNLEAVVRWKSERAVHYLIANSSEKIRKALGHARHDVRFYEEYLNFCKRLAESNMVKPQDGVPAPTPLRTLEHALGEWSRRYLG